MYAAYIGHDNVVNLLLEASVSVHIRNKKGQSALHLAASCGNESVAYFLLQVSLLSIFLVLSHTFGYLEQKLLG
jgi:ankyrin repeat protein